jgi:cytochrome c biogenesis protein
MTRLRAPSGSGRPETVPGDALPGDGVPGDGAPDHGVPEDGVPGGGLAAGGGTARPVGPAGRPGSGTDAGDGSSARPASSPGARRTVAGWLRWGWRQLTSMRTALVLLFLLAVASVPGSVIPQEGIDPAAVSQYYAAHPALAPILARLSLFSVFAAPWFAAIYLLLFLSLAGCVLPRAFRLAGSARQLPPRAPRNLSRLPLTVSYQTARAPTNRRPARLFWVLNARTMG